MEELNATMYAMHVFLEQQQEEMAALKAAQEQQEQEMAALKAAQEQQEQEREVCASPIGITALHAPRTILNLGTVLHLDHTLSPAGTARGDATDAWVARGDARGVLRRGDARGDARGVLRHAASPGRDHATPPTLDQFALGRAHQGAPELT